MVQTISKEKAQELLLDSVVLKDIRLVKGIYDAIGLPTSVKLVLTEGGSNPVNSKSKVGTLENIESILVGEMLEHNFELQATSFGVLTGANGSVRRRYSLYLVDKSNKLCINASQKIVQDTKKFNPQNALNLKYYLFNTLDNTNGSPVTEKSASELYGQHFESKYDVLIHNQVKRFTNSVITLTNLKANSHNALDPKDSMFTSKFFKGAENSYLGVQFKQSVTGLDIIEFIRVENDQIVETLRVKAVDSRVDASNSTISITGTPNTNNVNVDAMVQGYLKTPLLKAVKELSLFFFVLDAKHRIYIDEIDRQGLLRSSFEVDIDRIPARLAFILESSEMSRYNKEKQTLEVKADRKTRQYTFRIAFKGYTLNLSDVLLKSEQISSLWGRQLYVLNHPSYEARNYISNRLVDLRKDFLRLAKENPEIKYAIKSIKLANKSEEILNIQSANNVILNEFFYDDIRVKNTLDDLMFTVEFNTAGSFDLNTHTSHNMYKLQAIEGIQKIPQGIRMFLNERGASFK